MTHFSEQFIPHARLELLESFQLYLSGSGLGLVILAILRVYYSSSDKTTVIQISVFRARIGNGETRSHWVIRPVMEQCPCGLSFSPSSFLFFFFFKVRILFLFKPKGSVGEGQDSEGGTLSFQLNLALLSLTSYPRLLFCPKSTSVPIVTLETARSFWNGEPFCRQTLFPASDSCTHFLRRTK